MKKSISAQLDNVSSEAYIKYIKATMRWLARPHGGAESATRQFISCVCL